MIEKEAVLLIESRVENDLIEILIAAESDNPDWDWSLLTEQDLEDFSDNIRKEEISDFILDNVTFQYNGGIFGQEKETYCLYFKNGSIYGVPQRYNQEEINQWLVT